MAWYALGLIAQGPELADMMSGRLVNAAQVGDTTLVPDLFFVLLTVVMFVVLALVVRGGERL
jgi:hypothetical protein